MPPTPSQNSRSRTRATPYPTQASPGATSTSENTTGNVQRRPGCAKGLQGYSTFDFNFSKPTGNPSCPDHVQDARKAQKAIDARAHVVACNNVEEDTSSDGDGIIHGNDGEEPQSKRKHSTDPEERLPPPFLVPGDDDEPANPTRQSASAASVDNTNQPLW
ncbi:hypothetical protein PCASD_23924 [Puccinia coronata f. sp. avenae]|uniref:Uncharacterized protein n=1 Tax=Puccinia coronata f. sp. avenae TaxID=200324 RepID=A0A2N5SK61_9BASI|nr:hypothetical protein PCASD_23924 [Puccinia coronata f. sp. avenae]